SGTETAVSAVAEVHVNFGTPRVILGAGDSTRIELHRAHFGLTALGPVVQPEYRIEVGADTATLVVDFSEGDGCLQSILGTGSHSIDVSSAIGWSNRSGLGFNGQGGLEAIIPVHQSMASVLTVSIVHLALRSGRDANSIALQLA